MLDILSKGVTSNDAIFNISRRNSKLGEVNNNNNHKK